jgi:hypothetical protein
MVVVLQNATMMARTLLHPLKLIQAERCRRDIGAGMLNAKKQADSSYDTVIGSLLLTIGLLPVCIGMDSAMIRPRNRCLSALAKITGNSQRRNTGIFHALGFLNSPLVQLFALY